MSLVETKTVTIAEQIAGFATRASYHEFSEAAKYQLKVCLLDAIGCAIGALGSKPIQCIREHLADFGGSEHCTLIGGGKTSPDRAAFYNSALVRYLDFNDSFIGRAGTCHPSDNLGGILAAAEYADRDGRDFMTALAVAYQIQCRLTETMKIMEKGFDHSSLLSYAASAGIAHALGMSTDQTAQAIAISGDSALSLTVTRTHPMSNWKGLAAPNTVFGCMHTTFLAKHGITGPLQIFEGKKGFFETTGEKASIDWAKENLEIVRGITLKKYNSEVHTQSIVEAVLDLKRHHEFSGEDIEEVHVEAFKVAFNITGGGEWGDRKEVQIKEEADHSIPYILAVAILDGQVWPEQYEPARIVREDIQRLLQKVYVKENHAYTRRYPDQLACRVEIRFKNGKKIIQEKKDFEGFPTRPLPREAVEEKFQRLVSSFTDTRLCSEIMNAVFNLEAMKIRHFTDLLGRVHYSD